MSAPTWTRRSRSKAARSLRSIDLEDRRRQSEREGRRRTWRTGPSRPITSVEGGLSADARDLLREGHVRAVRRGDFDGTFHLFKGGRELKGTFSSPGWG